MENSTKIIILLGSLVISLLLVFSGMRLYNKSSAALDSAESEIDNLTNTLLNGKYKDMDGRTDVTGNEVLSFISECSSDVICITVKNAGATTEYIRKSADLNEKAASVSAAKDKTKVGKEYIDPTSTYSAALDYVGQTIVGVTFTIN